MAKMKTKERLYTGCRIILALGGVPSTQYKRLSRRGDREKIAVMHWRVRHYSDTDDTVYSSTCLLHWAAKARLLGATVERWARGICFHLRGRLFEILDQTEPQHLHLVRWTRARQQQQNRASEPMPDVNKTRVTPSVKFGSYPLRLTSQPVSAVDAD